MKKYISIISLALIALAGPVAAIADDFKYDDEPTVEVGGGEDGNPWEGDTPGIDIGVDDEVSTGIRNAETAVSEIAVKLNCEAATITIIATKEASVRVYRIGASAISILNVNSGENVFNMPHGVYVIAGRKYIL